MHKITLYFEDLKLEHQADLWRQVEKELLARGDVEPQGEDEPENKFLSRLDEAVDCYVNTHNVGQEYRI